MANKTKHPDRDPAAEYGWRDGPANFVDVFIVEVPDDITDKDDRNRIAFAKAEELSELYCLPCQWEIEADDGSRAMVKRTRAYKVLQTA